MKFSFIVEGEEKKRLIENFFSLSILQAANYLLPFITLPYLVRVLGVEKFGLLSFAQATISYFYIITDYGFNLSATREIAIHRDDKEKITEVFSSVMIIKIFLLLASFILLYILVFSFSKFRNDAFIYFLTFGMVVGQALFPVWFFQGMEKMKYITYLNILAKLIFTAAVFIFVKTEKDFYKAPLLNSLGFLVTGVISLWIIIWRFGIKFVIPKSYIVTRQLKEGYYIFISTVAISLYTVSNTFILGLFTNNVIVGYYSAGEKIVKAIQGLLGPISQTIYPYISKMASESKEKALAIIRKMTKLVGVSTFFVSLLLFIFAPEIGEIVLGDQFRASIVIIRILSFLPFIVGLSNIFAVQGLYAFGFYSIVTKYISVLGIIHIFIAVILTRLMSGLGVAISVIITETLITICSIYYFKIKTSGEIKDGVSA